MWYCSPFRVVAPSRYITLTEEQYWTEKVSMIELAVTKVGAGGGSNHDFARATYQTAINSGSDVLALNFLRDLHSELGLILSFCADCKCDVLENVGQGETLDRLEELHKLIATRAFFAGDLACNVMGRGIAGLILSRSNGELLFQRRK
ncbi:hypothetical protein L218DRAFT_987298 [Marasmius fiardii PR-910]|nr:hypothetical protein L218DRAFT_987298 [Marasmius fiardii PR-910]